MENHKNKSFCIKKQRRFLHFVRGKKKQSRKFQVVRKSTLTASRGTRLAPPPVAKTIEINEVSTRTEH